jgi:hypothetical protein
MSVLHRVCGGGRVIMHAFLNLPKFSHLILNLSVAIPDSKVIT